MASVFSGPETAAWRGLWSLALEAFPQHIAVRRQCGQEACDRLVSCQSWRHACRSSSGPKRPGGRGDERAGSVGPGAAQAADRFVSTAGGDAATATTLHVAPPPEIRYAGTSPGWAPGPRIPDPRLPPGPAAPPPRL